MFGIKKNKKMEELTLCRQYTIHWKEEVDIVALTEFIEIINECNLKIIALKLRKATNFEKTKYVFLTFGLKGIYCDFDKFETISLVDRRLNYLRKLGEGF